MKTIYLFFCFGLFFTINLLSQPSLQWDSNIHGPIANDQGIAMTVDGDGNVYVAGISDGITGAKDFLIVKYNVAGDTLWTRRYNGTANGDDIPATIKLDNNGNVYVTGRSEGVAIGDDIVTIKYSSSGIQQWVAIFNGGANNDDFVSDMIIDPFSNIYLVGSTYYSPGDTKRNGIVIKYNTAGLKLWDTELDWFSSDEVANLIAINHLGNIVVTEGEGTVTSIFKIIELNPANGTVIQNYNTYYDWNGGVLGFPNKMVLDGVGNIYVTSTHQGYSWNTEKLYTSKFTYGQPLASWNTWTYGSNTNQTIWGVNTKIDANLNVYVLSDFYTGANHKIHIKKLLPSGSYEWSTTLNNFSGVDEIPVSLALSNDIYPYIFISGYTSNGDIMTLKLDSGGNQVWNSPLIYDCGNNLIDVASAMVMDGCENIYITGYSNCSGTYNDIKTLKYSSATPPAITALGSTSICQGEFVTLEAESCVGCTYLWNTGQTSSSISVSPLSTTEYTVTLFDEIGCPRVSDPMTIIVNPIPEISITGNMVICEGTSTTLFASGADYYSWEPADGLNDLNIANPVVTPVSTTAYTVTGTTNAGCSNTESITVFVNSSPEIEITGNANICEGASTMLSATGASSYNWFPATGLNNTGIANPVANPPETTSYTVTGTGANGCPGTADFTVTVTPVPIIDIFGDTNICEGDSTQITATNATTYSWSPANSLDNPDIPNPNVFPDNTTIYTVTGTINGCSSQESITITVNPSPDVTVLVSDDNICAGSSTNLNAYGAISYNWAPTTGLGDPAISNPTAEPITTTTYTVTGDLNGCTDTASVTITVDPLPIVTATGEATICAGTSTILNAYGANSYVWSPATGLNDPNISNPVATPASTTTYIVSGFINECSDTDTVMVTVMPDPVMPDPIIGPESVCSGSMTTLNIPEVTNADAYTWILPDGWSGIPNGNTIIVTTGEESGNVSVNAENQCGESGFQTTFISVTPTPPQPTISQNENVLISDTPTGNQWYHNDIETDSTGQTYIATESGRYFVIVTVDGCPSEPSNTIDIEINGNELITKSYSVDLFPNPTSAWLNIKAFGLEDDSYTISLANSIGQIFKEVERKPINSKIEEKWNVADLPGGLYILSIQSNWINQSFRIFKIQ